MKATLTIDQGNSYAKATLFFGDKPEKRVRAATMSLQDIVRMTAGIHIDGVIYCSVGGDGRSDLPAHLHEISDGPAIELTPATPVPVKIAYATPQTLGLDRVAAAAGAAHLFPGEPLLIADAGTALTLDALGADATFIGGNIAPGIKLRLRALHEYTGRLPEVSKHGDVPVFGHDTETAIRSGAIRGVAADIAAAYSAAANEYGATRIVLTGGDAETIEPFIHELIPEASVQRISSLVPIGLNRILYYNENI